MSEKAEKSYRSGYKVEHGRKYRAAHPEKERERSRRYHAANDWRRKRDPLKDKARYTLRNAVVSGKVVKPKICSSCGLERKLHAHHLNYNDPFDVLWLCHSCHGKRHRKAQFVIEESTDLKIRAFLWQGHGHQGIYSDDGEMQCGECPCDYLRDPLSECVEKARVASLKAGLAELAAAAPKPADLGQEQTHFCQNTKQIELTSLSACSCVEPDAPKPAPACEAPPSEQMGSGTHVCPVCEQHQPHNHSELVGKGLPMALAIGSVHSLHGVAAILGKMREDYERAAALAASVPPPTGEK